MDHGWARMAQAPIYRPEQPSIQFLFMGPNGPGSNLCARKGQGPIYGPAQFMGPNGPGFNSNSWARTAQGPTLRARTAQRPIYGPEQPRVKFIAQAAQGPMYESERPRDQFMGPNGPGSNLWVKNSNVLRANENHAQKYLVMIYHNACAASRSPSAVMVSEAAQR